KSSVRETKHQVDTGFAPPAQSQRRNTVHQFPRVVLAQKEIIVIELDGIRAEVSRQMAQDAFGPGGRLHFLLRSICRNNAAETALIWTIISFCARTTRGN